MEEFQQISMFYQSPSPKYILPSNKVLKELEL